MRFSILGPTELSDGGKLISLGAKKQRGLLALLLLYAGRQVRVDILVEHLWPGGGLGDRRQLIYTMISRLRAVLIRNGIRHDLIKVGNAYMLDIDRKMIDVHEFRELVDRSREQVRGERPTAAIADLQRAVDLWRGDPLADLAGAAVEHLRRQLADDRLAACKLLATARLRDGQCLTVLRQLPDLIHDYDIDEELAGIWSAALQGAGRESEARRYLADFRQRFRQAFRAEPNLVLDEIRSPSGTASPLSERPHQLPHGVPGFVGRTASIEEIDRFAASDGTDPDRPNIVVVTGMPGIGKTALAIHWAQRRLDRFPDGQLYVDAAGFGNGSPADPSEILARFLLSLGVAADRIPADPDERRRRFNDILRDRRVLIVLDNVAESRQAQPLIPTAEGCLTVVTSRYWLSRLSIRQGGHHVVCSQLGEEEARTLLAQIVGKRRADAEPAALDRLAGVAGGLPLALRIIGEQIAERPKALLDELAGELQEQLLWAGAEGDELITVFAWSYNSLPQDAADLFRRLSLHPGARISLDAAAALAGLNPQAAGRLLNVLARAHLLEHDTARYYRLHDLLRQYAWACCQVEDSEAAIMESRVAILTWYLWSAANAAAVLAPQLPPVPDLPPAVRSAMEFASEAAALAWYQSERQNLAEATSYANRHKMYRLGWQLPAAIHDSLTRTGRYDDLTELDELGAESARHDKHGLGRVANMNNLGHSLNATHQYARAVEVLTVARALAAGVGHVEAESACIHNLGTAYMGIGDTHLAIDIFHEVLAISQRIGNPFGEAATLFRLAEAYVYAGSPERALATYGEALTIRERIGSLRGVALTRERMSALHLEAGEPELAAEHCALALAAYDHIDEALGRCEALITWADIERVRGSASAVECARAAAADSADLGDSHLRVRALAVLADALDEAKNPGQAARTRAEALGIAAELTGRDVQKAVKRLLLAT